MNTVEIILFPITICIIATSLRLTLETITDWSELVTSDRKRHKGDISLGEVYIMLSPAIAGVAELVMIIWKNTS